MVCGRSMDDHFGLGGSLLAAAQDVIEAVLEKIQKTILIPYLPQIPLTLYCT